MVLLAAVLGAGLADAAPRRTLRYGFPHDKVETFAFEVSRTTTTEFIHLPAEASEFDVGSLESRVGQVTTRVQGSLERVLAQVFRDDSKGLVTRLVGLEGTLERAGESRPLATDALEGKSVAMRVLASGELLDSAGWAHLAGAGRGASLVEELLLQTIMRLPASAPKAGDVYPANYRLRVPLDAFLMRDQTWVVQFEAAPVPESCGRGCVAFSYQGAITEKAVDNHPARPMRVQGAGSVTGTVVLSRGARALVEHSFTFDWDRTLRSERANGTLRGELRQVERVIGSLHAEGTRK